MKQFGKLIGLCLEEIMFYKTAFLINLLTPAVLLGGQFLLWRALFNMSDTGVIGVYTRAEMYTFIILAFAINNLFTWSSDNRLSREIRSGMIAVRFIRPVHFLKQSSAELVGFLIPQAIVNFTIVGFVFILFGNHLIAPSTYALMLSVVSLILGLVLRIMMTSCLSLICFYTTSHLGLAWTKRAITEFFSGALIPVSLFPGWLATISYYTPFPLMLQVPISIFLDESTALPIGATFLLQIVWIMMFFILHQLLYGKVRKNVTFAGG